MRSGSKIFLLSSNLKNLQEASLRIKKSFDVEVGFEAVDLRLLESCKKGVESALNKFGRCDMNTSIETSNGCYMLHEKRAA